MKKTLTTIIGVVAILLAITACQPKYVIFPFPGGTNTPSGNANNEISTFAALKDALENGADGKYVLKKVPIDPNTDSLPIRVNGEEMFKMQYQHDLIISDQNGRERLIGSIKTSGKDRLDKIFIDKFLYNNLMNTSVPHIAIFLNDVQRNGKHPKFKINSTFLPGHFKGYTIKLCPLDGVFYCDLRPDMKYDEFLKQHIKRLDTLFCEDIWNLLIE